MKWYIANEAPNTELAITNLVSRKRKYRIIKIMGSNPVQAWMFFRPYFHYRLSSVHYCEDHFLDQYQYLGNFPPTPPQH